MKIFFAAVMFILLFTVRVYADGGNSNISPTPFESNLQRLPTQQDLFQENVVKSNHQAKYDLEYFATNFLWSVFGGFLGAIIAILFQNYTNASLDIIASADANDEHTYPVGYVVPGRWKFFRVKVKNRQVNSRLRWLFHREPAQQVNAIITFTQLNKKMKGRWAGTLELPHANPFSVTRLANFPDPVTINPGHEEILDVFAKYDNDQEAYGWNNEAYLHTWRTPHYKLNPGNYKILIEVTSENGAYCKKYFKAHIKNTIDNTYLSNISS